MEKTYLAMWMWLCRKLVVCDKVIPCKSALRQRNRGFKFWPEVKVTRLIDILSAVLARINFFTWSGHYKVKELKLTGNLSDCMQILTVGRLTHEEQTSACECFLSKYFFNQSDFCTNASHFSNTISKTFHNFSLWLSMAKRRHVFEQIKLAKDELRFDL